MPLHLHPRRRLLVPAAAAVPERPREAVVLSGGGALGAAQVGALRALVQAGVVPDLLVGCSVGALNAAFLALDPTVARVAELERVWGQLQRRDVFGGNRRSVAGNLVRRSDHLYEPDALRQLISRWVPLADLGDAAVPCHVVTTDLRTGRPCWWSTGDPQVVLAASACLPALFPPVALGGSLHVDGGVTAPVPVERALQLGAVRTWVLDVSGDLADRGDARMSALDVLLHSFAISRAHLGAAAVTPGPGQTVVRLPRLVRGPHGLRDFRSTGRLVRQGYELAAPAVAAALVPEQRMAGPGERPTAPRPAARPSGTRP